VSRTDGSFGKRKRDPERHSSPLLNSFPCAQALGAFLSPEVAKALFGITKESFGRIEPWQSPVEEAEAWR
jgi:hypothetical protein